MRPLRRLVCLGLILLALAFAAAPAGATADPARAWRVVFSRTGLDACPVDVGAIPLLPATVGGH
jgi:hypothetical protein